MLPFLTLERNVPHYYYYSLIEYIGRLSIFLLQSRIRIICPHSSFIIHGNQPSPSRSVTSKAKPITGNHNGEATEAFSMMNIIIHIIWGLIIR
jgi:hypothetical protein